jgi:hypothetical protein
MPLVGITAWSGTASAHSNGNSGASTSSGGNAPPGNNGTIKVDEWTMDNGQDNDPQLPCSLSISFFGYDAGTRTATITLTPWAPTAGGHPYLGGTTWTLASRGNGSTWDANIQISQAQLTANNTFAGITPSHHGYHVRVEAEVNGSRGSDDKFKMFWLMCPVPTGGSSQSASQAPATVTPVTQDVKPAAASVPVPASTTPTAPRAAAISSGRSVSSAASTAAAPDTARIATASAAVPLARPATPVSAHGLLAFTGADIAALVGLGLLLMAAGCLLVVRRRPGAVSSD